MTGCEFLWPSRVHSPHLFGANGRVFFCLKQGRPAPDAVHLGFVAHSAREVCAAHAAALAAGGGEIFPPGPQPHYDDRYFAARMRDPDGYSFEVVFKSWQHEQGNLQA